MVKMKMDENALDLKFDFDFEMPDMSFEMPDMNFEVPEIKIDMPELGGQAGAEDSFKENSFTDEASFESFGQDFNFELPDFGSFEFDFGAMPGLDFTAETSKAAKKAQADTKKTERGLEKHGKQISRKALAIQRSEERQQLHVVNTEKHEKKAAALESRINEYLKRADEAQTKRVQAYQFKMDELAQDERKELESAAREERVRYQELSDHRHDAINAFLTSEIYKSAWDAERLHTQNGPIKRFKRGYYSWACVWDQIEEERMLGMLDRITDMHNRKAAR